MVARCAWGCNQQLTIAIHIHPVYSKCHSVASYIISQRSVRHQEFTLIQWLWIHKLLSPLTISINLLRLGLAHWGYEHHTLILVTASLGVDNTELAVLWSVVTDECCHHFSSTRYLLGMNNRCREPTVHSVILCLTCTVGVHLEQRLCPNLTSVAVIPAGIYHTTIIQQRWGSGVHLIETYLTHKTTLTITHIHIRHLSMPAVRSTATTGRVEQNIVIWQIDTLNVGIAQTECNLLQFLILEVHFIEMVVISQSRFLPRKQQVLAIEVNIEIAEATILISKQGLLLCPYSVHLEYVER